ncbi:MAG: chemotaxis protein CheB [Bacteroidia bacterium]|nr:chemotaxis protein CheB [Bacteroidia bacterium]
MEKDQININCKALIIGGSAGSIDVILMLLPHLKAGFKFPIIMVLHRKNSTDSKLSELFSNKTKILVKDIEDKDPVKDGTIYIAPADYHLLIESTGVFSLDASEKVNFSRPSIDVTFESAADVYQDKLVCILLSGANADGVLGLKKVKSKKGMSVVQEPTNAKVPFMPEMAIKNKQVDIILNDNEIAAFINRL